MVKNKSKTHIRSLLISHFFICTVVGFTLDAQELPGKEEIIQKMTLANEYFMKKWPDVGERIITDRSRASNIWTRGVYYEGLMALYKLDPKPVYYDYAVRWGEFHNWDLRDGDTYTRNADNQCAGQTYIDLYLIESKPERIEKIKACIDSMMKTPRIDDWSWIDALQMAMPVFAKLGVIYQDDAYYRRMHEMYMYTKLKHGANGLFNKKDGLWWRDKDFNPPYTEPNGEDCYWSRGNGWILAALARVLEIMPKSAPYRREYIKTFKKMAKALIQVQRKDGFWNVSLHDPDHFGGKETTGTALFTYGIAWGINNGMLCEKKYRSVVVKAWDAMANEAFHPDGMLGYVQSTGIEPAVGQPVTYDKIPDFEDFGTGCFLLAGSEVYMMR